MNDDDFAGLITFIEEFPKRSEELARRHEEFILNQDRWQHLVLQDSRAGKLDRMKDLLMSMRLGIPCAIQPSYGAYYIDSLLPGPRFMRLRRRLFKLTIGTTNDPLNHASLPLHPVRSPRRWLRRSNPNPLPQATCIKE